MPAVTRADAGLADDAIVLACPHTPHKVRPPVVDAWLRFALAEPRVVLWLDALDDAAKAGIRDSARHVIFEAAHGYTANVRRDMALGDDVMVSWEIDGRRLARAHGAPVRALVPDLYFWKSAKWLTGIRFVRRDEPGFWETRGYHNHADPWKEERYG